MTLLKVDNLTVSFPTSDGVVQAVRGLSFEVEAGQTLGIVGESGSGKSVSALTMLGLNPGADITGSVTFDGRDMLRLSPRELQQIRGADIAMIFQDPLSALHPHFRVGWQIREAIRAHTDVSNAEARHMAVDLLRLVNIPQPDRRVDAFPHELSGGMRQRVMIAMALALKPKLLIADEPTTALDATVQAQLMELLASMQREVDMAMIVITHDLGVVARIADKVQVMYAGRAAEMADANTLFHQTHHPYTRGLLASLPGSAITSSRLLPIVGQPPSLINLPSGCAFHPRCPFAMDRCMREMPSLMAVEGGEDHLSACYLPREMVGVSVAVDTARQRYAADKQGLRAVRLPGVAAAREEVPALA
ncbi:MAG: ABC transporter ATP-binding protein [Candidatus Dormibacteraeota bacterium]|nr:ABC transporter ATP-binding protein [Candidatus Dormibacteraeota bacterium]MBV8445955.1 ABC transporter ATP-binding protein [Candidatus Dormibacteraeota bacterium]